MSHQPLTLKYRPRVLGHVIGQDSVVNTIRGMFKRSKVNRSLLVQGPWGSGKTSIARIVARYVNCMAEGRELGDDPCGECESCKGMDRASHRDYSEINAGDKRGIDDIRSLRDQAGYMPSCNYRIYVLDEVHQLTPQAFQAFLKILEEPPDNTIFILCTTDPHKIPKPIVSRCMKLIIDKVAPKDAVRILKRVAKEEELSADVFTDDLLGKITIAVDGHPRDAIATLEAMINAVEGKGGLDKIPDVNALVMDLAEEVVGESPEALAAKFLLGVYAGKYTKALLTVRDVTSYQVFADTLLTFHSHSMYYRFSPKLQDSMMVSWYEKLQSAFPDKKAIDPSALSDVMDILLRAATEIRGYMVDGHFTLLNAAVKAANRMQAP